MRAKFQTWHVHARAPHTDNLVLHAECSFGELIASWGIFWRTLMFDLPICSRMIVVCAKLHNLAKDGFAGQFKCAMRSHSSVRGDEDGYDGRATPMFTDDFPYGAGLAEEDPFPPMRGKTNPQHNRRERFATLIKKSRLQRPPHSHPLRSK